MTARLSASETIREEGVNVHLAQLLRNRGISARAERRSREGIPDVRADLRSGDLVILECKWEESVGLLESQLDERLAAFPEALGHGGRSLPRQAPAGGGHASQLWRATTDLRWWVSWLTRQSAPGRLGFGPDRWPILPTTCGPSRWNWKAWTGLTAAADAVGYALEQAATQVAKHARISRRIADIIASSDQEKDRAAALRIGCLVLFNALAFQDRLAAANEDVPTVSETLAQGIPGLRRAWRDICDNIDYVSVFELAADILGVLGDGPEEVQGPVHRSSRQGDGGHPPVGRSRPVREGCSIPC